MAPVVSVAAPAAVPNKIKRPAPPGVQANGTHSGPSKSSPSPSMSVKKPPAAIAKQQQQQQSPHQQQPPAAQPQQAQQTPTSTTAANGVNGAGASAVTRPGAARSRRDTSNQVAARAQKNNSGPLRPGSLATDGHMEQSIEPRQTGM